MLDRNIGICLKREVKVWMHNIEDDLSLLLDWLVFVQPLVAYL